MSIITCDGKSDEIFLPRLLQDLERFVLQYMPRALKISLDFSKSLT